MKVLFTLSPSGTALTLTLGLALLGALGPSTLRAEQFGIRLDDTVSLDVPAPGAGNIEAAGATDRFTFTNAPGQQIFVAALENQPAWTVRWRLEEAAGHVLFDRWLNEGSGSLFTLHRAGTNTLHLYGGEGTRTGTYAFKLWAVPQEQAFDLPIGGTVSDGVPGAGAGNLERPGAVDLYRFTNRAGQRIYFESLSNDPAWTARWSWIDAAGNVQFDDWINSGHPGVRTLPLAGVNILRVYGGDPSRFGTYGFRISDVPEPQTFALPLGTAVQDGVPAAGAGNLESPGAVDLYTFQGTAGQRVVFNVSENTPAWSARWSWTDAAGNVQFDDYLNSGERGAWTLHLTGPNTIRVYGAGPQSATYAFQVSTAPAEQTFALGLDATVAPGQPAAGAGDVEHPGAIDAYTFTNRAGQRVFLELQSAEPGWALRWRLTDAQGFVHFDRYLSEGNPGLVLLAHAGTNTLRVQGHQPTRTGTYGFRLLAAPDPLPFDLALDQTVSANVPAAGAGTLNSPGAEHVFRLPPLPAGQALFFDTVSSEPAWQLRWTATDALGTRLFDDWFSSSDPGNWSLPAGGPVTVRVYGASGGSAMGTYSFRVAGAHQGTGPTNQPPTGQIFALQIGDTVSEGVPGPGAGRLEAPDQIDAYTFDAVAGETVFFTDGGSSGNNLYLEVFDPIGTLILAEWLNASSDIGRRTLTRTGVYRITVRSMNQEGGTYGFSLHRPLDHTFPIAIGDTIQDGTPAPGAGRIDNLGAVDSYTFTALSGQIVYFQDLGSANGLLWQVTDENGTQILSDWLDQNDPGRLVLQRGGTYRVTVSGYGSDPNRVGPYAFRLRAVPANQKFAIAIGDTVRPGSHGPGSGSIEVPGAQDHYTFTALPGQLVYVEELGGATGIFWQLFDEANNQLWADWLDDSDLGRRSLLRGGTYRIVVFPYYASPANVGDYSFRLRAIPTDSVFPLSVGQTVRVGEPDPGAGLIEVPGTADRYTFSALPGDSLYLEDLGGAPGIYFQLTDRAGNTLVNDWLDGNDPGRITLSLGGTYTAAVFPYYADPAHVGPYSFRLRAVPADLTFPIAIGDTVRPGDPGPGAGMLAMPGEQDFYTFNAAPGQTLYYSDLVGSPGLFFRLYAPDGSNLYNDWLDGSGGSALTLTSGGTYRILVHALTVDPTSVGPYWFRLWNDLPSIAAQPQSQTTLAGQPVTLTVTAFSPFHPLTYQWKHNGTDLEGATSPFLTLPNPTATDAGTYQVVVSNPQGSVTSDNAQLTLLPGEFYVTRLSPQGITAGPVSQLQVQFNQPVNAATFTREDVVITGPAGTLASAQITVAPVDPQTFTLTFPPQAQPGTYSVAVGPAIAAVAGPTLTPGAFSPAHVEDFEGGISALWNTATTTADPETTRFLGRFSNNRATLHLQHLPPHDRLRVVWDLLIMDSWDGNNGPDTWGLRLDDRDLPEFEHTFSNFGGAQTFPDPATVTGADIIGSGWNDQIFRRLALITPHTTDTLDLHLYGRYLQAVDDESWGVDNLRIEVAAPADGRFLGTFVIDKGGAAVTAMAPSVPQDTPLSQVEFEFNEPITAESVSASTVQFTSPSGTVELTGLVRLSASRYRATFAAQRTNGRYTLRVGPAILDAAGNAMNQDGDATNGEAGVDAFEGSFELLTPPVITTQPASQTVVRGATVSLSVVAQATAPVHYQWSRDGVELPDATSSTLTFAAASPQASGTYFVTVTDDGGSTASLPAQLTVLLYHGTFVAAAQASPTGIPPVPGDGVSIDLFNLIGGGAAPTPSLLEGRVPSGRTLSPVVDFPHPDSTIAVGTSFNTFFADTTTPPEQVQGLSAANFILRIEPWLRVTSDLDLYPETPEVDLKLGVGSDDGFHLRVADQVIGTAGDRGFTYSWFTISFEQPGLYPLRLLFAANATGASGLEFAWQTATSPEPQIIPQSALYLTPNPADRLITFEEHPVGTRLNDQYLSEGIRFKNLGGDAQITDAFPGNFVPVSPTRVFADPNPSATQPVRVELQFAIPGSTTPAVTTLLSFFVIDAETTGATVEMFDPEGTPIFTESYHGGRAAQELVSVAHPRIARAVITLGQGTDIAALDNLRFSTPQSINRPPTLTPIADRTADESTLISIQVQATDPDEGQSLTYSLSEAPEGASIHPLSGAFTWTPSESQGPGVYPVTVRATDNAALPVSATTTFTLTVREVNQPPAFLAFPVPPTRAGGTLQFTALAADPDLPAQVLTFSLDPGAPAAAQINPTTGAFTWAVPPTTPTGQLPLTLRVTDNAPTPLSVTRTLNLVVDNQGPRVLAYQAAGPTPGNTDHFDLTFDKPIDAASFTTADVTLTGPTAPAIQAVVPLSATVFRVQLAAVLPFGEFTLAVGPAVLDLAGNPMNQDGDATNGEVPADRFTATLSNRIADLTALNLKAPASAFAGQPIEVSWITTNRGEKATAPWIEHLLLASDSTANSTQTLLRFTNTLDLAAAASIARTQQVIIPSRIAGPRWLALQIDADSQVPEGQAETNNLIVATSPTQILAPDLAVVSVAAPASSLLGQTARITWVVRNAGQAPTPTLWTDRLVLSSDNLPGADIPLFTTPALRLLAPDERYTNSTDVVLPATGTISPGTYFILAITDTSNVLPEPDEANNLAPSQPLQITLPPLPDLVVNEILVRALGTTSPLTTAAAGQTVEIVWTARNLGSATATGPWHDSVYLSSDTQFGNDLHLLTTAVTGTLPPNGTLVRAFPIRLPIDGPAGALHLSLVTDTRADVFESNEDNNAFLDPAALQVPLALTLQLPTDRISEGQSQTAILYRNGDRATALTVQLQTSDRSELTVPNTVSIPAGASSASFNFTAAVDNQVDGAQSVTVTASAPTFTAATAPLTVLDVDIPRLVLVPAKPSVGEGLLVEVSVQRPLASPEPLTVTLESSSLAQLVVPESVTIPAHQTSTTALVAAAEDTLLEPPRTYTITGHASDHQSGAASLTVLDNDVPEVTLVLAQSSLSEGAGPQASTATLTRDAATDRGLVVTLTSSGPSLIVPPQITIPAGQTSTSFPVGTLDDTAVNGTRSLTLTGQILDSTGTTPVADLAPVAVTLTDDDGPTLRVSIARKLVAEGLNPATTATITRNTDPATALTLQLTSSDSTEITLPATASIPANQTSVTVPLSSVNDGTTDGNQTVTITARAAGFTDGTDSLVVSDGDLPDLIVARTTGPATADTDAYVPVTYRIENQGSQPAGPEWSTRLFLSSDSMVGDDQLLGSYSFKGNLPPGQYFEQTLSLRLPSRQGPYWIVAQVDVAEQIVETLENNNIVIATQPIQVRAAYTATVQTSVDQALAGTPIPLTGQAFRSAPASPAPEGSLVNIHVRVRNTKRIISALVDRDGRFQTVWRPLPNEAGTYEIGAAHPGDADAPTQDTFTLLGMKLSPAQANFTVVEGTPTPATLTLDNLSTVPLTGLTVAVLDLPPQLRLNPQLPTTTLAGATSLPLPFTIETLDPSLPGAVVRLQVTSAEGATTETTLGISVEALRPRLEALPQQLIAGMLRGQSRALEFKVVNRGGRESGPLSILLPNAPWLSVASDNPSASIPPGGTNIVTLHLTPATDLPLGPYTGTLALSSQTAALNVPFEFRAVSENKGDLRVTAVDEYTYYAEGSPKLADARVSVRDPFTYDLLATGTTAADGTWTFPGLPEGYYAVEVTADRHTTFTQNFLVEPGILNELTAFLSRETVRYTWKVEPVEIEDHYKITIETEFETVVPTPVITVEPTVIDLAQITADVTQVDIKITNHGLVAALDTRLGFPEHPAWVFTPLIEEIGVLPARSSLTIPLTIRRLSPGMARLASTSTSAPTAALPPEAPNTQASRTAASIPRGTSLLGTRGNGPCHISANVSWELICGPFRNSYSATISLPNAATGCDGGPVPVGTGIIIGPGGGYIGPGGTAVVSGPSVSVKIVCDPRCLVLAALGCIPGPVGCFFSGYSCGEALGDGVSALDVVDCGMGAIGCLVPGGTVPACIYAITRCFIQPATALQSHEAALSSSADPLKAFEPGIRSMLAVFTELSGAEPRAWFADADSDTGDWFARFFQAADPNSDAARQISASERQDLLAGTQPPGLTPAEIQRFLDRWNRTLDNYARGLYRPADAPAGENRDFIDRDALLTALRTAGTATRAAQTAGFNDPINAVVETVRAQDAAGPDEGVCARVRLRLEQEAVITRDAFRATLEINNQDTASLEEIQVVLHALDAQGRDANAFFGIRPPELSGLSAVDGTGSVAPNTTGTARWILIPTVDAAPDAPLQYFVSGEFSYTLGATRVRIPLEPVAITVLPTPRLQVKYFHQRDVYSDDPFTDPIEPSIPYSLAVLIQNRGKGSARNFQITSAQPQIIENEKGLLIDFKIIATEVSGQNLTPSLTANFGEILPDSSVVGRWLMTSTLQGLFTDYTATFEHVDGLGNPRLSLIEDLSIHEMIRLVQAGGSFEDGLPDFFVNQVPDPLDLGDTLYTSQGATNPVQRIDAATLNGTLTPDQPTVSITLNTAAPAGWLYLRIPDPGNSEFTLRRVLRSDGVEIPVGTNAWTTDRTFVGLGKRPIREARLHLLDYNSPGSYTLHYDAPPAPDTTAPESQIAALPADSFEAIPLNWSGSDTSGSGIAFYDILVSENGGPFLVWLQRTPLLGAVYPGKPNAHYAFFSLATDNAGNRESQPGTADATTQVTRVNLPPEIDPIADQQLDEGQALTLEVVARDPEGDSLTYSLAGTPPPGVQIHPLTGRLSWATGEADGPSHHTLTVQALDNGTPRRTATRSFALTIRELNTPPTLQPIANAAIREGQTLSFTCLADDSDLPKQALLFALGPDAPRGATILPQTGVFTWRPDETQGGRTNRLSVIVLDSATPSLTATQSFQVVVRDLLPDFIVELGTTNVVAGDSGTVPLKLVMGRDATEVTLDLRIPVPGLTSLALTPLDARLASAVLQPITADLARISLTALPGQVLQLSNTVARLTFQSRTDLPSIVVPLILDQPKASLSDGNQLTDAALRHGRVFRVQHAPILEAVPESNRSVSLYLFGRPGRTYAVEFTRDLTPPIQWEFLDLLTFTSSLEVITPPQPATRPYFYRAYDTE